MKTLKFIYTRFQNVPATLKTKRFYLIQNINLIIIYFYQY